MTTPKKTPAKRSAKAASKPAGKPKAPAESQQQTQPEQFNPGNPEHAAKLLLQYRPRLVIKDATLAESSLVDTCLRTLCATQLKQGG